MKKVVSMAVGVLLAVGLALPVAADEGGSLAGFFEEMYSVIAGWFEINLDSEPTESEATLLAPGETGHSTNAQSGPGDLAEMTPMTLPGG